jgi:hypothetical protein
MASGTAHRVHGANVDGDVVADLCHCVLQPVDLLHHGDAHLGQVRAQAVLTSFEPIRRRKDRIFAHESPGRGCCVLHVSPAPSVDPLHGSPREREKG